MLKVKLIAALAALAAALGVAGSAQADTQTFGTNYGWATVFIDGGSDWMHVTVDGQTATSACTYVGIEVERPGLNWKTKVARACAPRGRNVTVHHDMYHYGFDSARYVIVKYCKERSWYQGDLCTAPKAFNLFHSH